MVGIPLTLRATGVVLAGIMMWAAAGGEAWGASRHPTLFSSASDGSARVRPRDSVHQQSADLVLVTAEWAVKVTIPSEPVGGRKRNADGTYNPAGLQSAKAFLDAGMAIQSVVPVLGVAYQLTGNKAYAQRATQWLDAYASWSGFDVAGPDIAGAASLVGMVSGYDLFFHEMSPAQRRKLLTTIERVTERFVQRTVKLAKLPLESNRALIGNNHNVVPAAAAGLGALLLKLEGAGNGQALEQVVTTFRRAIIPAAFSVDGEYVDGTDQWLVYVMNSMTPFFEALRRNGGPNLWEEARLRKAPEYWIRADAVPAEDTPYNYRWRYTLLALASAYRDGELQGLALKEGLGIGPTAKEMGFSQHNAPEDGRAVKRWYSSAWEFLFYDPAVAPAPLRPRPLAVHFRHLGEAILRSSWKADATVLKFRAGPTVGKDEGDNNAFQLRAFGHDVLPRLEPPFVKLEQRGDRSYEERDKFQGTEGNNTILVDDARQFSMFDPKYKKAGGPKRPKEDWQAPEKAEARITGFTTTAAADYVAGEAADKYRDDSGRPLLDTFRRHLFFVKGEYVVVVDEIKTGGGAREIEWRFHGGRANEVKPAEGGFVFQPVKKSGEPALLKALRPNLTAKIERMAADDRDFRSPFVAFRGRHAGTIAIFVVDLRARDRAPAITVEADTEAVIAVRLGGDLLVWNRGGGSVSYKDLTLTGKGAWVRPEVAALLAEGTELGWKGNRLVSLSRRSSGGWPQDGRN